MSFEMNLRITEQGIDVVDKRNDGTVVFKHCPSSEFLKILKHSTEKEAKFVDVSGRLPSNCIEVVTYISNEVVNHGYMLFIEGGEYQFTYYDTTYHIPLPNMLMFFKLEGEKFVSTKIYIVLEPMEKINENTQIFIYPFGNVSSKGGICWGSNVLPQIKKPIQLTGLPYLFLTAKTGDHNFSGKTKFEGSQRDLLEALQKKEIELVDYLIPYKLYGDLIEELRQLS